MTDRGSPSVMQHISRVLVFLIHGCLAWFVSWSWGFFGGLGDGRASPQWFITDRSGAVVMVWFLLAVLVSELRWCFAFVHYTFSSVLVAEWPPFGK